MYLDSIFKFTHSIKLKKCNIVKNLPCFKSDCNFFYTIDKKLITNVKNATSGGEADTARHNADTAGRLPTVRVSDNARLLEDRAARPDPLRRDPRAPREGTREAAAADTAAAATVD